MKPITMCTEAEYKRVREREGMEREMANDIYIWGFFVEEGVEEAGIKGG